MLSSSANTFPYLFTTFASHLPYEFTFQRLIKGETDSEAEVDGKNDESQR